MARPMADDEDVAAVTRVLRTGQWAAGPEVTEFEREFASFVGARHAIAVCNGTTALHAALLGVGVGPGDLVLTTPFTFIATSNAIVHCGAKPVFVDIDPETFLIDPDQVEAALRRERFKAILIVHLFGQACDMDRLNAVAAGAATPIVEDGAQSHGAQWQGRTTGSMGAAGTFSFYATKNLATGEGGMVTTSEAEVADRVRRLINHGRSGGYEHAEVGYNYRMTSIVAALGRTQLAKLAAGNRRRAELATRYSTEIRHPAIQLPKTADGASHVFHQYTIRCASRDKLRLHLQACGISSAVIYPLLSYQQAAYRVIGKDTPRLPHAEQAVTEVLSIPVFPGLTDNEASRVIDACNSFDAGS